MQILAVKVLENQKEKADDIDYTGYIPDLGVYPKFWYALLVVKLYNLLDLDAKISTMCWCHRIEMLAGLFQKAGYLVRQLSPMFDYYEHLHVYRPEKAEAKISYEQKMTEETGMRLVRPLF